MTGYWTTLKAIPKNGVALFYGDGALSVISPPRVLQKSSYVCGGDFALEPLLDMQSAIKKVDDGMRQVRYLVILGCGWVLFGLSPETGGVQIFDRETADLPKNHKKGGQSAPRYQRQYMNKRARYVSDALSRLKLAEHEHGLPWGYVVGARGKRVDEINNSTSRKGIHIVAMTGVSTAVKVELFSETFMLSFVAASALHVQDNRFAHDAAFYERFISRLVQTDPLILIGKVDTGRALREGRLDTLVVHPDCASKMQERSPAMGTKLRLLPLPVFRDTWGGVGGIARWAE